MSGYRLTYRAIVCYPNLYCLKICSKFYIHEKKKKKKEKKSTLLLELISLWKKNNPRLLLLLNICKLSYFITYKCLNREREREREDVGPKG